MTLPVATDCYQVRSVWENSTGPRPASFDLHFIDDLGTQDATNLGSALVGLFTANMWKLVAPNASMRKLLITPLDGTSATYSQAITVGNANISGNGTGDAIPQGCQVVTVQSPLRGKKYRNRAYLPFVGEGEQAAGILASADVATAQTAWTAFLNAMVAVNWLPAVVSPSEPGPTANNRPAVAYVCRGNLTTQRRRAKR